MCNYPNFWVSAGRLESKLLEFDLDKIKIERPVYVCGLARSGSTILLEFLAEQKGFVSHRYSDFPFIFTPYIWRKMQRIMKVKPSKHEERFHGDGLLVNSNSPEAMEEVLWMNFLKNGSLEKHYLSQPYSMQATHKFSDFYKKHIQKLLLVSGQERYLAKGNYNIGRINTILDICSGALFFVPIRHPVAHVESLLRQHDNFLKKIGQDQRGLKHLQRVGHFEFGPDVRPQYLGNDNESYSTLVDALETGDMLVYYARYWAYVYGHVANQYKNHESVFCYRYEDFCSQTEDTLKDISKAADIMIDEDILGPWVERIKAPDYYQSSLTDEQIDIIHQETADIGKLWGYEL